MFDQKQRQRMILRYRHVLKQQFPDQSELFFADLSQTIVAAIVTAIRQVSAGLDGPKAYWASIILNIIGQVIVQLQAPEGSVIAGTV
ncbi:hypothetical protein LCGC14_2485680, partial [marine sediment metagenome]